MDDEQEYFSVMEVARILRKAEPTIRTAERQGRMPKAARCGGRRMWPKGVILAFAAEQERQKGAEPVA